MILVYGGALMLASVQSGAESQNTTQVTNATPILLPAVERPATVQPMVGDPRDSHLDKTPPRQTKGLDLVKMGWTYNCMECHKLFPARWHFEFGMNEHKNIQLAHGNNRFCLNCHHPGNRNAFVDYDGSEIAQADVVLLCAKCHGPTYRDWEAGVHGRVNGHWDTEKGPRTKLRCIQCHDPHSPAFKPMKPLPPLRYPPRAAHAGVKGAKRHGEEEAVGTGGVVGHATVAAAENATERARPRALPGSKGGQVANDSEDTTPAHVAAAEDGRAPGIATTGNSRVPER